jgi:phenol 2-monooxygenase (NADPH)
MFLDALSKLDITVARPVRPTELTVSQNEKELEDPNSYPVKVVLEHLQAQDKNNATEIIHAKYVVGADGQNQLSIPHHSSLIQLLFLSLGAHSWVRRALGIEMEGEQTGKIPIHTLGHVFIMILDHVWGAIDFTTTSEANFPDWRHITTIKTGETAMMLIPREGDKLRLYISLGEENGLIDTATGRVAAQNLDAKRLLEASV